MRRGIRVYALLILLLLALAIFNARYFYNVIWGPFPLDPRALASAQLSDFGENYFVTVQGDDILHSGFIKRTIQSANVNNFFVLFIGSRALLVEAKANALDRHVTGEIKPIPPDIRAQIIGEIETTLPKLQGAFLPFMLKATDSRMLGWVEMILGGALFGFATMNLFKSARKIK